MLSEQARRIAKTRTVTAGKANGQQRSPVHWDGDPWLHGGEGTGCVERAHMPRAESRTPAGDGQQCHVKVGSNLGHAGEQFGVAGEIDDTLITDQIAERLGRRPTQASAGMVSGHRDDPGTRNVHAVSHAQLSDFGETSPSQPGPGAARQDQGAVQTEQSKRG